MDVIGVELDLIFQTVLLFIIVGTDPAIGGNPKWLKPNWIRIFQLRDFDYILGHDKTSILSVHACMNSIPWGFLQVRTPGKAEGLGKP